MMDWIQFSIFITTIIVLILALRSDIQQNRAEAAADRRDMLQLIREIQQEQKEFHGRLCGIEERKKNESN
jgi:hypothetical protein